MPTGSWSSGCLSRPTSANAGRAIGWTWCVIRKRTAAKVIPQSLTLGVIATTSFAHLTPTYRTTSSSGNTLRETCSKARASTNARESTNRCSAPPTSAWSNTDTSLSSPGRIVSNGPTTRSTSFRKHSRGSRFRARAVTTTSSTRLARKTSTHYSECFLERGLRGEPSMTPKH